LLLTVGRIGRAHGVRGEVTVEVLTDRPDDRFFEGAQFTTEPVERGPLRIESLRVHNGILLLSFAGRTDRNAVESLRNTYLMAEVDVSLDQGEDEFHIAQILGCKAITHDGQEIGEVVDVLALPAQDTLVINHQGREVLVPFVKHHVPELDLVNRKIFLSNLDGLI
jgi:16S rRNA processing protein RimM